MDSEETLPTWCALTCHPGPSLQSKPPHVRRYVSEDHGRTLGLELYGLELYGLVVERCKVVRGAARRGKSRAQRRGVAPEHGRELEQRYQGSGVG